MGSSSRLITQPSGVVESLDVSILRTGCSIRCWASKTCAPTSVSTFVGGLRGTKELERLVDEGKAAVAFSLHPTTVDELLMVSDANQIMPPKSTWFEPKLRDGLLIHTI